LSREGNRDGARPRGIWAALLIVTLLILAAIACEDTVPPAGYGQPFGASTPYVYNQGAPQAGYTAAQATLAAGQSEMMWLSHQAAVVSLNMTQAAGAAAQNAADDNQRQLMELSIRSTEVSLDMARAAAMQQFILEQTQIAGNETAIADSQDATATSSAYTLKATQTARAQELLAIQSMHTVQAYATQTAASLTATPWTALQADILRTRNENARRAIWNEFVVTPLTVILITLVVLLLIVGGVMAYLQLMPALELRLRTIYRNNDGPLLLADGMVLDHEPSNRQLGQRRRVRLLKTPRFPGDETPQVEIVDSSDPSIINWITEAENQLRSDEGRPL